MKKRLFSLVLCLVMVFSLLPAFSLNASAAEPDANGITNPEPAKGADDQLHLTKSLAPGENGTYDLTLESWATGEVTTDTITEKVPTDFVIVVDQSGSMNTQDMATGGYTPASNQYLESIANSSTPYYYKDGDQYYRVYAKRGYLYEYHAAGTVGPHDIKDHCNVDLAFFSSGSTSVDSTTPYGQYYYKDGDQMRLLYLSFIRRWNARPARNHFSLQLYYLDASRDEVYFVRPDNDVIDDYVYWGSWASHLGEWWITADGPNDYNMQNNLGNGVYINYPMFARYMGYTELCYQDAEGKEYVIPTTNGTQTTQYCDTSSAHNAITDYPNGQRMQYSGLYTASGMETRLAVLNSALNSFASAVANEKDDFGAVDNRVSIVGFSSPGYSNTELLTHTERNVSGNNGWQKNTCDGNVSEYYGKGLVPVTQDNSAGTVNQKVTDAIGAITANGGTQPEDGLDMAYKVLDNRSEKEYEIRGGDNAGTTVPRNQVVIFFTDGRPGNNDAYDQYVEANEVVDKAKDIKQELGATIFSIGVFGESDGNPLTYPVSKSSGTVYDLGYVSDCEADDDYYLYRQWRANNAAEYGEKANDTIFSYMSVVSSNYPDAEGFITQAWINGNHSGTYLHATDDYRHKETAEATNKYYRMASNQQSLIDAFLQAATMNSESIHSDTAVPLDATAVFKDDVNLSDFDVSNATYTVKWQPVKMVGDELQNNGEAVTKVNAQPVPADGKIEYSGFDYSGNYVTSVKYGQKLVVVISGLAPKKASGTLLSNAGNAGVYGAGEDDPTVSIESPTLNLSTIAAKTYVIDFNAKMKVAEGAYQLTAAETNNNGVFAKSQNEGPYDVTYQLNSGKQADKIATINSAYTDVDTAMVYGKPYDLDAKKFAENAGWTKINTVPASSVYYDDSFTEENAPVVNVGDGSGNISGIAPDVAKATIDGSGKHCFTFYGTGIDVYCTTDAESGFISAAVFKGTDTKGERVGNPITVKNYSGEGTRYNTPTVSFKNLGSADTYTIMLSANAEAKIKIDGVRVYNPVQAGTTAAEELNKTPEANATYLNLRSLLVNGDQQGYSVDNAIPNGEVNPTAVSGVLFIDDVKNVVTKSHYDKDQVWHEEPVEIYQSQFDVYKANGPKNEIYLDGQQAITFQLNIEKVKAGGTIWIGLSAPETGSGTVSVTTAEESIAVNSVMDMYYPVTVPKGGSITITNNGTNRIALTNLKITAASMVAPAAPAPGGEGQNSIENARAFFMPVTLMTVRMAANNGVDPEAVVDDHDSADVPDGSDPQVTPDTPSTPDQPDDPKPVWNDGVNSVQTILKTLFQYLLNSLNSLFSGLGKW